MMICHTVIQDGAYENTWESVLFKDAKEIQELRESIKNVR